MNPELEKKIQMHYLDVSQPGSLSGFQNFYRALRKKKIPVKKSELLAWMMSQEPYTMHRRVTRRFKRNKTIAGCIDNIWQIDLVDMKNMAKNNDNYKYILTCIDVFSKYAWVVPLFNKTGIAVLEALKTIIDKGRVPNKIHSDEGTEFFNRNVKKYFSEQGITLYKVNSELKASTVERFNRTFKEKMYRYFTYTQKYRYIDILDDLVSAYNKSYHRSIKMAPEDVNKKNEHEVRETLYGNDENIVKFKFQTGDKVRISKFKRMFAKGYTPNWTREVFTIDKRLPRVPPVYILKDLNGESLQGVFYEQELQKIIHNNDEEIYKVESILKKRTRNGQLQYYVSWLGYPSSFNSWIKASDLHEI